MSLTKAPDPDGVGSDSPGIVLDAAHGKVAAALGTKLENTKDTASLRDLVQKGNAFRLRFGRKPLKRGRLVV
jgi:hypothetical protein